MAKIDELLKELCPDGVEWKTIQNSIVSLTTGVNPRKHFVLNNEDSCFYYITGKNLSSNKINIDQSTDKVDANALTLINKRAKLSDDILLFSCAGTVGKIAYVESYSNDWTISEMVFAIKTDTTQLLPKYLMYMLNTWYGKNQYMRKVYTGALTYIKTSDLLNVIIPLPSIKIQQEIVEVLDTFTDAISNLEEELALREKQFEFYREQLLAFDDESSLGGKLFSGKVEWKELQDVSSIVRGASPRPIKNFLSEKSEGIPWIKIGDADPNDKYIVSTAEFINKQGASKSRFLKKGSFILSNSMSFGRPYILAIDGCIHDGWIAISDYERQINADYLYYVLKTANVKKYWSMSANNGAVSNLNADIVRGTVIPIPSLCAQQDIVEILNTFEAMIVNIKEEIALRTKQYEYYREKLLSFGK